MFSCPLCLCACREVSSYTNLLQGDTNRSDFFRERTKPRTHWQGAEMSVWQADPLLYHNLIHPVRVWEDVFDELATQISKEFVACSWSSHTSGIRIHLEREDHSLSITPFALALQFMTPRCLEGWLERWECPQLFRESRCYQTRLHHQLPDHTDLFWRGQQKQLPALPGQIKNGQENPILQTAEDSFGVIQGAAWSQTLNCILL